MSAVTPADGGELSVILECHALVCAVPALSVERLALRDEVTLEGPSTDLDGTSTVLASGTRFAAWDLAQLLELGPLDVAWILLRIPSSEGPVPIALRAGACLVVQRLPPPMPLPESLFRARARAIRGVFAASVRRAAGSGDTVGLALDPAHLFTAAELHRSRAAAARASS